MNRRRQFNKTRSAVNSILRRSKPAYMHLHHLNPYKGGDGLKWTFVLGGQLQAARRGCCSGADVRGSYVRGGQMSYIPSMLCHGRRHCYLAVPVSTCWVMRPLFQFNFVYIHLYSHKLQLKKKLKRKEKHTTCVSNTYTLCFFFLCFFNFLFLKLQFM